MSSRTIIGFDYGRKRIGCAVGQELTSSARPLTTVAVHNNKPDWDHIARILEEWQPDIVIVGLPLNMDGTEHDMSRSARRFSNQINGRFNRPVELVDERLTSLEAEEIITEERRSGRMKKKSAKLSVDQIAAELIIKAWMAQ